MQISHPTLGSPNAMVTSNAELVVTGSVFVKPYTDVATMKIGVDGHVSTLNSSTTPLVANGSFVGQWEDISDYSIIYNAIRTDQNSQDSGNYGLNLEFSMDGSGTDICEEYYIASGTRGSIYSTQPSCKYFRVNYVNGPSAQGLFRLQTQFRHVYGKPSSHRIDETINDQNDAELTKSVITGKNPHGLYVNYQATTAGNFKNSLEEYEADFFIGSPLPVRNYDNYVNGSVVGPSMIDPMTFATVTIDESHEEIHGGDHYSIRNFTSLNSGNSLYFSVTTPSSDKWTHMEFQVEGTTRTETKMWEGATISGGTIITPLNSNRNSTKTSSVIVNLNPTISGTTPTSGLLLEANSKGFEGTTPAAGKTGGEVSREDEWVLKSGTTYLWEIKSVSANNIIDYNGYWYEHESMVHRE